MFCSNCGNQLEEGAKFCTYCGTKIAPLFDLPTEHENTEREEKIPERMSKQAFHETALPPTVRTSVDTGITLFFVSALIYLFLALFDIVTGLLMAAISVSLGVIVKKTKSTVWAVISCAVSGLAILIGLIMGSSFTFWMAFAAVTSLIGCTRFDKAYKEYLLTGALPLLSDADKRVIEARAEKSTKKPLKPLVLSIIAVLLIVANAVHCALVMRYTKDYDVGVTGDTFYRNDYYGFEITVPASYDTMTEEELEEQNVLYYGENYSEYGTADLFDAIRTSESSDDAGTLSEIIVTSYFNATLLPGLTEIADDYLAGVKTESREKVGILGTDAVAARFKSTDEHTGDPVFVAVFIFREGPYTAIVTVLEQSFEALDQLTEKVIGYKYSE